MRCECGTIIASILLLLDLEPRIRDSNFQQRVSSNSNVFPREWKQRYLDVFPMGTQETSLLQKYRVHTGFSFIPLEFLPNFHACSRYFGNTRRFLKRGNFAVNFRQGPVLISTSDIIETRLYTSWDRIWTSNRMGDEKFYEERIFEKVCFVKEKFRRSWKFKEFRETL